MSETLIKVEGVAKKFCRSLKKSLWYGLRDLSSEIRGHRHDGVGNLRKEEFWSINDVGFKLQRGECLGLIGPNGAGKSTLLKMLSGLIKPDCGRITVRGRVGALIELGAGFNPILTGRENVFVNASILGMPKKEINGQLENIVEFSGINEFIDSPVQSYSSGMKVRLGFAVAAHLRPHVLLVDEVLAVGDFNFQLKCIQHMRSYKDNGGAIILVSHNMHAIQSISDRVLLLERGEARFIGHPVDAITAYYDLMRDKQASANFPNKTLPSEQSIDITSVTITSVHGEPPRVGSGLTICLQYTSRIKWPDIAFGFSLWSENQDLRIATCTSTNEGKLFTLPQGDGKLVCTIKEFPMAAGTYALKGGIYDAGTSWPIIRFGWDTPPIYFTITMSDSSVEIRRFTDGDLLALEVDWHE